MFEDYYTTTKYIYNFNVAGSVLPYGDNQVCEPTKTIGCQQVPETNLYYGLGKVDT